MDRSLGKPLPHQQANPTSAALIARGRLRSPAFPKRTYAVLANLSTGYPPLQGTFRCITHPFATRRQAEAPAAVRLACVKHAASVQSEPGSNSSVQSNPTSLTIQNFRMPSKSIRQTRRSPKEQVPGNKPQQPRPTTRKAPTIIGRRIVKEHPRKRGLSIIKQTKKSVNRYFLLAASKCKNNRPQQKTRFIPHNKHTNRQGRAGATPLSRLRKRGLAAP